MFRSLILGACLIGVVAGLLLTAVQSVGVTPILLSAEQYEAGEMPANSAASAHSHGHGHGDAGHHHGGEAWAPEDGIERLFYTGLSNILAGIGFSAILLVVMHQLRQRGQLALTPVRGLFVGLICYLAVFLAPALGLPPEIPGAASAALESRQLWWIATVTLAAAGLGLLLLARGSKKALGLPLLAVPYLFVPAHLEGPLFPHPDPDAVTALHALHQDFIWASAMANLAFWLVVGVLCAVVLKRLAKTDNRPHEQAAA